MAAALEIRRDLFSPTELRARARREHDPRTATRMLAIANALEGLPRAEAARLAGMERQALRDAVIRSNQEGLAGLRDRPKPGRPPTLTDGEQALLRAKILQRPGPQDGCRDWTLLALCGWIETRFAKHLHPAAYRGSCKGWTSRGRRPDHALASWPESSGSLRKRGLAQGIGQAVQAPPDQTIALWFMDEAQVGQKRRTGFRWWMRVP